MDKHEEHYNILRIQFYLWVPSVLTLFWFAKYYYFPYVNVDSLKSNNRFCRALGASRSMHFTWAPVNEALNGLKIYDSQKEKKYLSQYNHFSYFDVAKVGNSFAIEDALCIKKRKAIASSSMTHSTLIRSKLFGVNHVPFDDVNPYYSIQKLTS